MAKKQFLFGFCTLRIKGTNIANILKTLKKQNITPKSLKKIDNTTFEMKVKANNVQKVVAILDEKCYNIIKQKSTFESTLKFFSKVGILIGLFVGILLNVFASFFVWKIEFVGDKNFEEKLSNALKESGVCVACPKSRLKFDELKKSLFQKVENLSLVSFNLRGSTLFVEFTTRVSQPQQTKEATNVLAKNSGIVSSIVVLQGTAMVKQGDYVQKGDILIAGFEENENGKTNCMAKGQVFAYTFKSATLQVPAEKIEFSRTGNFVTNQKVTYLNETLFETQTPCPFKKFETETKQAFLSTTTLPLKIFYTTFFELEEVLVTQDFEKNKQKFFDQAKLLAFEELEGYEEILEEKTETNFVSNIWFVSHYIKIKEKIS